MAASTIPLRPTASSPPQDQRARCHREGGEPSLSPGPRPVSGWKQASARVLPPHQEEPRAPGAGENAARPGDRRGRGAGLHEEACSWPELMFWEGGFSVFSPCPALLEVGPEGLEGRPQESGVCIFVHFHVLCESPPPRRTGAEGGSASAERGGDRWPPAPSAGWSLGLRLSWVTGARHRAMPQGHWIWGAPRGGPPSWADTLNAAVPAGTQELP